jgi:hypothetical protein
MADIYCTKKLEKVLGKSHITSTPEVSHRLGSWNANLFPLSGRKCLIMTNDVTCYTLLFLDILKKDLLNFQDLFYERLIDQLEYDGIEVSLSCAPELLNHCSPAFRRTNNNRKILGTMNDFVFQIDYIFQLDYAANLRLTHVAELNNRLNDFLVGALRSGKRNYGKPRDEMQMLLDESCK